MMAEIRWYQTIAYDVAESDYVSLAWSRNRRHAEVAGRRYMTGWSSNMNNPARSARMRRSFEVVSYDIAITDESAVDK